MINLLEKVPGNMDFESLKGCVNVALTPEACFILDEHEIPYNIPEDYYSEAELLSLEDDYFNQKTQWLGELDHALAEKLPEFRNQASGLCSHYLGYSSVHYSFDNVLIRSLALRNLWEKVRPEKIRYYRIQKEERFNDLLLFNGDTVFSRLIPLFCAKYHTDLDEVIISWDRASDGWSKSLLEKAKSIAATIYLDIGRQKFLLSQKSSPLINKEPFPFLFLAEHWGLNLLLAEAMQRGHKCYLLKHNNKIIEIGKHNQRIVFQIKEKARPVSDVWLATVTEILESRSRWEWFDQLCSVPASTILKPRIGYFLTTTTPKLLSLIEQFSAFLSQYSINYVVSAVWQGIKYSSAAYAAKQQGIERIMIRHGEGLRDARIWESREIRPNDRLIVINKEIGDYFASRINNLGLDKPEVHIADYQFRTLSKIRKQRRSPSETKTKPLVVYVPTMFMFDARYLHGASYPCTWYYQLQRHLVDCFAERKDYNFVFKGIPVSDRIYNPIPLYLKKNKFKNITYSKKPFRNWLSKADHVLIDYPLTALYEAIAAGVPYFVLLNSLFKVRQKAVDMLGERCVPFTTIEDAINTVKYFLDNPDLPLNLEGFIESGYLVESLENLSINEESL